MKYFQGNYGLCLCKKKKIIPLEMARAWESYRVTDISNPWCRPVEIYCHGYHCFLCCVRYALKI